MGVDQLAVLHLDGDPPRANSEDEIDLGLHAPSREMPHIQIRTADRKYPSTLSARRPAKSVKVPSHSSRLSASSGTTFLEPSSPGAHGHAG